MADADATKKLPALRPDADGESADLASSGVRTRKRSIPDALTGATRAALELAIEQGARVSVMLRGDASRNLPISMIEGVVRTIAPGRDGQDRVTIDLSEDASQIVLLSRIVHVAPLR